MSETVKGPVERMEEALRMIPKMPVPPMDYSATMPLSGKDHLHVWRPGMKYVASIEIEDFGRIEGESYQLDRAWDIVRMRAEERMGRSGDRRSQEENHKNGGNEK